MKSIRSFVCVLLALLLAALSACGTPPAPPTAESLLAEMGEKIAAEPSLSVAVQGSLALVRTDPETGDVGLDMDLDLSGEMIRQPMILHVSGSAGLDLMGMDMDLPLEIYAREQDGGFDSYTNVMGLWMHQRVATDGSGLGGDLSVPAEWGRDARLAEETEIVNGRAAYRIDMTVTGEMFAAAAGRLADTAEDIAWGLAAADTTLWIDRETQLPLRQTLSITAPIRSGELSIQALSLVIDYTGFGAVSGIDIPPEALSTPELGSLPGSIFG